MIPVTNIEIPLTPMKNNHIIFNEHVTSKKETKIERDKDRQLIEPNTSIVCIDLENVLSLPKSNVGNSFYKRKLSCYNLTGHCSLNKKAYCAYCGMKVWLAALEMILQVQLRAC